MSQEQNETSQASATSANWSTQHVTVLGVVALIIGLVIGYAFRGSSSAVPATAVTSVMPASASIEHGPPSAPAPAMPSDDQMKHMAAKQAEPLMAKLEKNPNDAALLAEVGKTYLKARQFDTAAEYFERSVKSKPDANVLNTLGGTYHFAGARDKALDAWHRALKIDPNHADSLVNIGLVKWREEGDAQAAIAAWKQMLKGNPQHPQRAQVEKMIAQAQKHASMTARSGN